MVSTNPTYDFSQNNIPNENDDYFFFRLNNRHEHDPGLFLLACQTTLLISRREYFAQATSVTCNMLNSIGIVEPTLVEYYTYEIYHTASIIAENPDNSYFRILFLTINIMTYGTLNELGEIERVMSESSELFQTVPAIKSSIEALKKVKVDDHKSLDIATTVAQCTICFEKLFFENNDKFDPNRDEVVQMPCSHLYHKDCIVQWLQTSHMCPLCRYAMPT